MRVSSVCACKIESKQTQPTFATTMPAVILWEDARPKFEEMIEEVQTPSCPPGISTVRGNHDRAVLVSLHDRVHALHTEATAQLQPAVLRLCGGDGREGSPCPGERNLFIKFVNHVFKFLDRFYVRRDSADRSDDERDDGFVRQGQAPPLGQGLARLGLR